MATKEELKNIQNIIKQKVKEYKKLELEINQFRILESQLQKEIGGNESTLIQQIKRDAIEYEMLPEWLKIYKKK